VPDTPTTEDGGYPQLRQTGGGCCRGSTTTSYILKNPSPCPVISAKNWTYWGVHRLGRLARGLYAPTYSLG